VVYNRTGIRPGNPGFAGLSSAGFKYLLKWQAELYAEDPLKYSQTLSSIAFSGGAASCPNAGTAVTFPVITLTTGASDPILLTNTTTGQTLRLHVPTVPIPPGPLPAMPSTLHVDMYLKNITDGSGNPANYVRDPTTPWWGLVPGANAVTVSPSIAGTVVYRSAWI